jgi:hypothetical protein
MDGIAANLSRQIAPDNGPEKSALRFSRSADGGAS